jgi:hypothetical protein
VVVCLGVSGGRVSGGVETPKWLFGKIGSNHIGVPPTEGTPMDLKLLLRLVLFHLLPAIRAPYSLHGVLSGIRDISVTI